MYIYMCVCVCVCIYMYNSFYNAINANNLYLQDNFIRVYQSLTTVYYQLNYDHKIVNLTLILI